MSDHLETFGDFDKDETENIDDDQSADDHAHMITQRSKNAQILNTERYLGDLGSSQISIGSKYGVKSQIQFLINLEPLNGNPSKKGYKSAIGISPPDLEYESAMSGSQNQEVEMTYFKFASQSNQSKLLPIIQKRLNLSKGIEVLSSSGEQIM